MSVTLRNPPMTTIIVYLGLIVEAAQLHLRLASIAECSL